MSNDLELLNAIEESLMSYSEELDLSDSIERLDIVEREWEHVPVTLPEAEMPTQAAVTSYFSTPPSAQPRSSQESQSTMTSLASGLVSSAMASIWRGWGKSDKWQCQNLRWKLCLCDIESPTDSIAVFGPTGTLYGAIAGCLRCNCLVPKVQFPRTLGAIVWYLRCSCLVPKVQLPGT